MEYPKCRWCGHEFRFRFNYYDGNKSTVHLETEWSNAHDFGGEYTRKVKCPSCGKPCEIGYKCTIKSVSRKAKVVGE